VNVQDDDYELMPHNELEYLRHEVEKLRRNPLGDTQASIGLLDSINKLNASITRLNDILAGANDDMVKAYNDTAMQEQMRKMLEQQEKLARGIVAVAELVKEVQKKQESMPDIDSLIKQFQQAQPSQPAPQAPSMIADAPPVQQRNPFADTSGQEFQPLLNQPLPRPTMPQRMADSTMPGSIPSSMPSAMPGSMPGAALFGTGQLTGLPGAGSPPNAGASSAGSGSSLSGAAPGPYSGSPPGLSQNAAGFPQNAPGFMMNPGLQPPTAQPQLPPPIPSSISDLEVPLPPRRR
jgi:hypothetical protein